MALWTGAGIQTVPKGTHLVKSSLSYFEIGLFGVVLTDDIQALSMYAFNRLWRELI